MHRIDLIFYICNMETTQNRRDQQGHRLAIRANIARIELLEFELGNSDELTPERISSLHRQIAICRGSLNRSKVRLNELIESDNEYQLFIIEYKALTSKIEVYEMILSKDNNFENAKNVKKQVKLRKQLKNAYLKSSGMKVSDLNEMIENSLKTI